VIAFVGSVFSPYYAWSGRGDPENHCALNVALYGRTRHRWTMTERPRAQVRRQSDAFSLAASSVAWQGDDLIITVRETAAPIPSPVRGRIQVSPRFAPGAAIALDQSARHWWAPIAPVCDVAVDMTSPGLSWRGPGYLDANWGVEPLETGFSRWDWTRAHQGTGCVVAYRGTPRTGAALDMVLRLNPSGEIDALTLPPVQALPSTVWGIARATRADSARLSRTLEDAPFYARSELHAQFQDGPAGAALHESLNLDRFGAAWVKALLPVRMPRQG
jgi:carotenoid 1,2-hydratase